MDLGLISLSHLIGNVSERKCLGVNVLHYVLCSWLPVHSEYCGACVLNGTLTTRNRTPELPSRLLYRKPNSCRLNLFALRADNACCGLAVAITVEVCKNDFLVHIPFALPSK